MSLALAMIDPTVQHDDAPGIPPYVPDAAAVPPPIPQTVAADAPAPLPPPPNPSPTFAAFSPTGRLIDPAVSQSDRNYAIIMHLSLFLAAPMPFLSLLAPVIMWQIKKHESPFLDDHGREAVNFHLSMLLYGTVFTLLSLAVVGIPLLIGAFVLGILGAVFSAVSANRGEYYRYPMCLRFLK